MPTFTSAAAEKALAAILEFPKARGGTPQDGQKRARALAKALSPKDGKALLALIGKLAATIGERSFVELSQLEYLAVAARVASPDSDAALAALCAKHHAAVSDTLVQVLSGESLGLPPGAQKAVAALLDSKTLKVTPVNGFLTLYQAMTALFTTNPEAARARWRSILEKGAKAKSERDEALVRVALGHVEQHEPALHDWVPLVATLEKLLPHQVGEFRKKVAARGSPPLPPTKPEVATEGGPPLLVPATVLSAWLGVDGPKPFDSGESDYERAVDAGGGAVLKVGKGEGVVLHGDWVEISEEPSGLLLRSDGKTPGKAWKKTGSLTVGKGGVWVLDSAEPGKSSKPNRTKVDLAAGRYDVLSQRSGSYEGVRLVRAR